MVWEVAAHHIALYADVNLQGQLAGLNMYMKVDSSVHCMSWFQQAKRGDKCKKPNGFGFMLPVRIELTTLGLLTVSSDHTKV